MKSQSDAEAMHKISGLLSGKIVCWPIQFSNILPRAHCLDLRFWQNWKSVTCCQFLGGQSDAQNTSGRFVGSHASLLLCGDRKQENLDRNGQSAWCIFTMTVSLTWAIMFFWWLEFSLSLSLPLKRHKTWQIKRSWSIEEPRKKREKILARKGLEQVTTGVGQRQLFLWSESTVTDTLTHSVRVHDPTGPLSALNLTKVHL